MQAARWPGPDDHPGYREAIAQGMVSEGPAAIRNRVRRWMSELFAAQQTSLTLEEPVDWTGWDESTAGGEADNAPARSAARRHPADRPLGGQMITSQARCESLQQLFRGDTRGPMDDQLRRRSVGAPAARSLLLTILGEYVLPRGEPVWQETLVAR